MASVTAPELEYPSSDGQPMAETGIHVQAIILLHQALQDFFRDRPDVFVASDMFWYWNPADTSVCTAPDVMVVPGVGSHQRRTFNTLDENGAVPAVVFEMASQGTWRDDLGKKFSLYEELGVREYFLFDPEARHLVPPLQGYRLNRTAYRRLLRDDDCLESELGFRLRAEGAMLRLSDLRTGFPILTRAEQVDAARVLVDHAEAKAADAEAKAADAAAKAADAEARAAALAAEVERLKALLAGPGRGPTTPGV